MVSLVCVSMYLFCILKNRILTHKSVSISKSVAIKIVDERMINQDEHSSAVCRSSASPPSWYRTLCICPAIYGPIIPTLIHNKTKLHETYQH